MNRWFVIPPLVLLIAPLFSVFLTESSVRVFRVLDGDTVEVRRGGSLWRVRLAGIDAPEKGQRTRLGSRDAGLLAKFCLEKLLRDRDWILIWQGRDFYGRVLGELRSNDDLITELFLEAGCGIVYQRARASRAQKGRWARAQDRAQRARRGLWSFGGFESPYRWRKNQKTRRTPVAKL
jgi:micrococcal nuclease